METGQINMLQMLTGVNLPSAMSAPSTAAATSEVNQKNEGSFAGILLEISPLALPKAVVMPVAANTASQIASDPTGETTDTSQSEIMPDLLAMLLASVGSGVSLAPVIADDGQEVASEQKRPETQMPQDEALYAAGAQVALEFQMISGMPGTDQKAGTQVDDAGMKPAVLNVAGTSSGIQNLFKDVCPAENAVLTPQAVECRETPTEVGMLELGTTSKAIPVPQDAGVSVATTQPVPVRIEDAVQVPAAAPDEKPIVQEAVVFSVAEPAETVKTSKVTEPAVQSQTVRAATSEVVATVHVETAETDIIPVITAPTQEVRRHVGAVSVQAASVEPVAMPVEKPIQNAAPATVAATEEVHGAVTTEVPKMEFETRSVAPASEIPAAKTATLIAPKMPLQQIMEAYSRPFTVVSDASGTMIKVQEQRSAEAIIAQATPQVMVTPATQGSLQVAPPVDTQSGQHLDTAAIVHADAAVSNSAVPATQEQGVQKRTPTPLPVVATIPEQPLEVAMTSPVQRVIETGTLSARAVLKMNDGHLMVQEEQPQQQLPTSADVKAAVNAERLFSGAVKEVSFATTGEDSWGGEKSPSDPAMSGQVLQVLQHQIKTEAIAATLVKGSTTGVAEQVVKQVGEHLVRHEIKTGSEQIVIRLSPENLGELKVSLRMENQRLTVEIVSENRMVREALIQNSDTLKDSLAKQNIKMDSFNVSTGGNNSGFGGRGQNDWRELAQNRQALQWQQSGGYNMPNVVAPEKLAYNPHTEYGMLDVHF